MPSHTEEQAWCGAHEPLGDLAVSSSAPQRRGARTLLVSQLFPPHLGGTPTWFHEVYRRYPDGQALVLTDRQPGGHPLDADGSLPVVRVPMHMTDWGILRPSSAWRYASLAVTARRVARRHRVDVLHCARAFPEGVVGYVLHRLTGLPYSVYAHGEEIGTARASRQLALLARLAYAGAASVIANARHTEQLLADFGVDRGKITVINPGVDTVRFRPGDVGEARRHLGLADQRVLLTVGRLQRRKGHDVVIRALPAIAARVRDVRYVIAGSGEELPRLRAMARELGVQDRVDFLGAVSADVLPQLYQACDVFVMPNREEAHQDIEGFGIVFLEAASTGKPVIGGRSGGTEDAIAHGETGLLVDGTRPTAVADAAVSLLTDPDRSRVMGTNARLWAQQFSWEAIARRTRELGAGSRAPASLTGA